MHLTTYKTETEPHRLAAVLAAVLTIAAMILSLVPSQALAATDIGTVYVEAALLGDLESGAVLFDQNADERIIPASTTKVMTALLIIEAIDRGELDPEERVWATQDIIDGVVYDASRVLPYIQDGEDLTVKEYLYCIMLGSDCVACDILANRVSGSVEEFVRLMNQRAGELGCSDTNFVNTHGYPADDHYTTPRSLFLIMREAMRHELFREIIATIKTEIPATEQSKEVRKLYNSNWMIWDPDKITSMYTVNYYPYSIGGKTGSSKASGHCLVSCAKKDGMTLVAVVTGGASEIAQETGEWTNRSFSESRKLFEWGFDNFERTTLMASGSDAGTVTISGGQTEQVGVITAQDLSVVLPKYLPEEAAEVKKVFSSEAVRAPVSAGDVLGSRRVPRTGRAPCGGGRRRPPGDREGAARQKGEERRQKDAFHTYARYAGHIWRSHVPLCDQQQKNTAPGILLRQQERRADLAQDSRDVHRSKSGGKQYTRAVGTCVVRQRAAGPPSARCRYGRRRYGRRKGRPFGGSRAAERRDDGPHDSA